MRITLFVLWVICAGVALTADAADGADTFRKGQLLQVADVDRDDVLNLRSAPNAASDVIASLSSRAFSLVASGETSSVGGGTWIKVRYHGVTGWANGKFLAPQYGLRLTRQELFDLGVSVAYEQDFDRESIPEGYAEGPQHKNRCPFSTNGDTIVSVSDALLRHFEGRGFSLETLCLGLSAPINVHPETGYDVPAVNVDLNAHHVVLLNLPDCLKNGTPLLDCRITYNWFWGRVGESNAEHYVEVAKEFDALIRRGIAKGEINDGPLVWDRLLEIWEQSPLLKELELGFYFSFCDVSPRYPRGYACALSTQRNRGDAMETGDGSVSIWGAATEIQCVKEATCTPTSIFFGTVRKLDDSALRVNFTKDRNEKLTLGRALVTVPKVRARGTVTRPGWSDVLSLRNPYSEDPSRHFTIPPGGVILYPDEAAFVRSVSLFVRDRASFKEHAIVFVHGFNVSFENALYRTAQLTYDLGDNAMPFGTAFLFSWPSAGELSGYLYDSDSARNAWAIAGLVKFLRLVADKSGAKQVHVIAHSMGNLPMLAALDTIAKTKSKGKFSQVVFAAPDVDRDEFEIIAQRIQRAARGFTLYASARDRAMMVSRQARLDTPRAGDVTAAGPVIVKGVDTIDATDASLDYFSLRHSEYAENKALIDDLAALLTKGVRPPDQRSTNFARQRLETGTYWKWKN